MQDSQEIMGGEIQYFRLEPEYWEPMIRRFRSAGLSCVTTYVQWATHLVGEPDDDHPAGVLDFEGKTNPRLNVLRFLDLVKQYDLNLNFRCGPFCCNEMVNGGYPDWIVFGDPGMMVWDWQNRTTQGYWIAKRQGSQPSYLHPTYLDWCARWFGEVDKIVVPRLKKHGGCISMMNLDNEISYIVQDGFLSSDYNPINVRPGGFYHRFLQQKYGSINNLPYGRKYACFEDVPAPRSIPEQIGDGLAYYTDWCEFKTWVMTEYIRKLRQMHEANGVEGVTFMTNFNPHRPEGVPTRMPDFEEATGGICGYDFYRGSFMTYSGYQSMARVLKLMNASLSYTWSAEFMSGIWNKILPSRVSDDHMRFMARCALAQGCKSISWFMFHDRDGWGDSPVSSHGHSRPSLDVLRETMSIFFSMVRGWDSMVPQTDAAIIYDLLQHQHTYIGDPFPCDDDALHIGAPCIDGVAAGLASQEYEGLFRLVEHAGHQPGVVDIMHSPVRLDHYRLAFLPGSPVVERSASKVLSDFIKHGGTLVVSGAWPKRDEHGKPFKFLGIPQPDAGSGIAELKLGPGTLVWFPNYLAGANPEEDPLESIEAVLGCMEKAGIVPAVKIAPSAGEVQWVDWDSVKGGAKTFTQPRNLGSAILHVGPEDAILFVLNHYPEAAVFTLALKDKNCTTLINLDTGEEIPLEAGLARVDVDRKSAAVFRVL